MGEGVGSAVWANHRVGLVAIGSGDIPGEEEVVEVVGVVVGVVRPVVGVEELLEAMGDEGGEAESGPK